MKDVLIDAAAFRQQQLQSERQFRRAIERAKAFCREYGLTDHSVHDGWYVVLPADKQHLSARLNEILRPVYQPASYTAFGHGTTSDGPFFRE